MKKKYNALSFFKFLGN